MLTVTRKQQLLEEFRTAGLRGLTADEMHRLVGGFWKLRVSELREDGCVFLEHQSRRRGAGTFRWVLVLEPTPDVVDADEDARLLDPPATPPGNAIHGET